MKANIALQDQFLKHFFQDSLEGYLSLFPSTGTPATHFHQAQLSVYNTFFTKEVVLKQFDVS